MEQPEYKIADTSVNTIRFYNSHADENVEILRLSREGIWANPDVPVDEAARLVLDALDSNIRLMVEQAVKAERAAMMQLFTDPENQPTQHGTVTVEYMQREIAAEREACAKVCEDMEEKAEGTECCKWPTPVDCAYAIRARGQA